MLNIIPAEIKHASLIASLLVREYEKINQDLGYSIYKTDLDLMNRVVEKRLAMKESEFKYFLLVNDNGSVLAFSSLLLAKRGEVLMLVAKSEAEDEENLKGLLDFSVNYLRENGAEYVVCEVAPHEVTYQKCLNQIGGKVFANKFVL